MRQPLIPTHLLDMVQMTCLIPISLMLTVLGVFSNLANIMIFLKMQPRDSMTISLMALSISDLLFSCINLAAQVIAGLNSGGVRILFAVHLRSLLVMAAVWYRPLFHKVSALVTTFISVERALCVVRPFFVKFVFTKRRCIYVLVFFYLSQLATLMPVYVTGWLAWDVPSANVSGSAPVLAAHFSPGRGAAEAIAHFISGLVVIPASQVIITISGVLMVVGLRRHQEFRMSNSTSGAGITQRPVVTTPILRNHNTRPEESLNEQHRVNRMTYPSFVISKVESPSQLNHAACPAAMRRVLKEDRLVKVVLLVSVMHVTTNTPALLYYFARRSVPDLAYGKRYSNMNSLINSVVTFFASLNSSLNIFIYIKVNDKFKKLFQELFLSRFTRKTKKSV